MIFQQYKTSRKFSSPQDYDITISFYPDTEIKELTRKEVYSNTAERQDLTIEEEKKSFQVRAEKQNTKHLNMTVRVYGFESDKPTPTEESSSANNLDIPMATSLLLGIFLCIHRIIF